MSKWYQSPICLPALDADEGSGGVPSDHLIVMMKPLTSLENNCARVTRQIKVRPLKQSGIDLFGHWIKQQTWSEILNAETVDEKAETLQDMLLKKCDEYLPVKTRKITTDDQPFCTQKMKYLKRMKNREFRKDRRSEKWKDIESRYKKQVSQAKKSYYKNMVQDLKHSNPSQWYSKLKRLCSLDPNKAQPTIILT